MGCDISAKISSVMLQPVLCYTAWPWASKSLSLTKAKSANLINFLGSEREREERPVSPPVLSLLSHHVEPGGAMSATMPAPAHLSSQLTRYYSYRPGETEIILTSRHCKSARLMLISQCTERPANTENNNKKNLALRLTASQTLGN